MSEDKEFVPGLFIYPPHENAPEFVKGNIVIICKDLGNWLRGKTDEKIKIDIKESKGGKWYAEVSNYKPKRGEQQFRPPRFDKDQKPLEDNADSDEIPF